MTARTCPEPCSRRYTSQLRAGHRTAHLFTESTVYRYIEELATPKKWFKANADGILALYGKEHRISKEDLYLGKPSHLSLPVSTCTHVNVLVRAQ